MFARSISGCGAALLLLSACASTAGGPSPAGGGAAVFSTADFAWSKTAGRGRIEGQLTYSPRGAAYTCADTSVVLTPETPWVRRRMEILYNSASRSALPADEVRARTPPERSQDYSNFVRRTTCDASGRFAFSGLPDGAWFVITVARPRAPATGKDMAIMQRVVVRGGQTAKVAL